LRELRDAFALVQQGRAVNVYVRGRSGLGKSALVQRFLDSFGDGDHTVVLRGRCYEHESVPYKALDSLIDSLTRYLRKLPRLEADAVMPRDIRALARVFPVLRRVEAVACAPRRTSDIPDQRELRRRAFAALRELLTRLGDRRPLVLSIDDLQWGDVDSAAIIVDLLRPPDPPALLLVGCYRTEDVATSPFLRALDELGKQAGPTPDRRELVVDPLTETEAEELAASLLGPSGASVPAQVTAMARESGGNPLFLHELVRHVQRGVEAVLGETIVLDEVLWARITRLPEPAQRLLQLLAVAGRPLGHIHACRAAGLDSLDHATTGTLRSVRLVRTTFYDEWDEIETYHDRIRETVIAHLPASTLQAIHRQLAVALELSGGYDPEVLAVHFRGAGDHEKAAEYFVLAAARAAEALAFEHAARLYRTALELGRADDPHVGQLRTRLGDALANAGRGKQAAEAYLAAAASDGLADTLDIQRRAAMQYLISGHLEEGLDVLRSVLSAVGMTLPSTPRRAICSLLFRRLQLRLRGLGFRQRDASEIAPDALTRIDVCWSAALGLSVVDFLRGAYFNTRALLLALDSGEPHRLCRALAIEAGHVAGIAGPRSHRRTERLLDMAERLAQQLAHPYALGSVALAKGIVAFFEGRWRAAHEFCNAAERIYRDSCTGVAWEIDTAHAFSLWSLTHIGDVTELRTRWPVLLKEARERGDLYAETNMSMGIMPLIRLAADDPAAARSDLREITARWPRQGFQAPHVVQVWDEGQIHLYTSDAAAAWDHINEPWPLLSKSFTLRSQEIRVFLVHLHARSALAAASTTAGTDSNSLLTIAQQDARRLEREQAPWAGALAQLIRAGIATAQRDSARAATLFNDAIIRLDAVDMRLYATAARRRLGAIIGGDTGRTMAQHADCWMAAQGIQNTTRMTAMLAPGGTS
jgi:tetratricopeptide (TPR) repeat protein